MLAFTRRVLLTALIGLAVVPLTVVPSTGHAEDQPDFSGTWELDRKASESLDDILKVQGISYIKRKVVGALDVTQRIQQSATTLNVEIETVRGTRQTKWVADGEPRPRTRADGLEVLDAHVIEGEAFVTTTTGKTSKGVPFTLISRRTVLEDGKTTAIDVACTVEGTTHEARRLFRRGD